ncbi:MAG: DUF6600 domain-containing protein [Candidatus Berkiellales bacterium]
MKRILGNTISGSIILGLVFLFWNEITLADPPSRVARLSDLNGPVSILPNATKDWINAKRNMPLTTGDQFWNDQNTQLKLQLPEASICIGSNSSVNVVKLDDQEAQFVLRQGSMILSISRVERDQSYEIDTPNLAFAIQSPGNYRVDVDIHGNATIVSVADGQGQALGQNANVAVNQNQSVRFSDTNLTQDPNFKGNPSDHLDQWCANPTNQKMKAASRYVSEDVIGREDLDHYGTWSSMKEYGPVWTPNDVPDDWAPYRMGSWSWVVPWGWTWVGDELWGFAPYHYGRWIYLGPKWYWVPGPADLPTVYAPALVAFMGGVTFNWLAANNGGYIGWFPLGPREVFWPAYPVGLRYFNYVNLTNARIGSSVVAAAFANRSMKVNYVNFKAGQGITAVSKNTFMQSLPVNKAMVNVPPEKIAQAAGVQAAGILPAKPTHLAEGLAATLVPASQVLNRAPLTKSNLAKEATTAPKSLEHVSHEKEVKPETATTQPKEHPTRHQRQEQTHQHHHQQRQYHGDQRHHHGRSQYHRQHHPHRATSRQYHPHRTAPRGYSHPYHGASQGHQQRVVPRGHPHSHGGQVYRRKR